MKRKFSYAIVIALCGMMGFTSCTITTMICAFTAK